jgi:ATP-binding cassette, subfamily B, heavy metal transporter
MQTFLRILPYLWPRNAPGLRLRVAICLALMILAKIASVAVPWLYKATIDALAHHPGDALVAIPIGLIAAYGLTRVIQQVFAQAQDALFVRVLQRATRVLSLEVFDKLCGLSLGFHLDRRVGALARSIKRGTDGLDVILRLALFRTGPAILELVFVTAILWVAFDWRFAAIVFATIGGYVLFTFGVTEWRLKFRRMMNARDGVVAALTTDALVNIETVKAFGNETLESRRLDVALAELEDAAVLSKGSLAITNAGQAAIISAGLIGLMALAAAGIRDGAMTVGDFVLVNTYLLQLYMPLNLLGLAYQQMRQGMADMEALFGMLDETPEVADAPDAHPLPSGPGEIAFRHVAFAYGDGKPLLHDIDFIVPAGTKTAIVGASGSGKSTVARLLLRFYDATAGAIEIDGHDLRAVTQASLRRAVGLVPQDAALFNDTIGANIAYGRANATPEEIDAAAKVARIRHFVVHQPNKYDTLVGERGLKLSGGERQRVAIARAVLKNPPILIFDEATSSLDTATEADIQQTLEHASVDRTTLVIAHRLSTVVDADQILVMAKGRIVERGRHAELLAASGAYATLWAAQQRAEVLESELRATRAAERNDIL